MITFKYKVKNKQGSPLQKWLGESSKSLNASPEYCHALQTQRHWYVIKQPKLIKLIRLFKFHLLHPCSTQFAVYTPFEWFGARIDAPFMPCCMALRHNNVFSTRRDNRFGKNTSSPHSGFVLCFASAVLCAKRRLTHPHLGALQS